MLNVLKSRGGLIDTSTCTQALIEVDCDINSDYLVISDVIFNKYQSLYSVTSGVINKVIVPLRYATKNDLLIYIIDKDRTYGAQIVDGVKPRLIDAKVTSIR